jgi:cell shape-determining protein MreC
LNRASTTPATTLAAVLIRPPVTPYDEIVIDLGTNDGVASGTPVYAPGNIMIGRVTEALGQTSKVLLLSSPGLSYSVLIGSSNISATAEGQGGGQYQAKVPHGSVVAVGDTVIDTALSSRPFGVVASVVTDPSDPFDDVLITLPVDPYSLRWVFLNMNQSQKKTK